MADGTLDEAGPQGRHFRHAHAARQHAAVDALLGIADRAPLHMAERAPHWLAAPPLAEARMHPADTLTRPSLPNSRDHYDVLPRLRADQLRVRGAYHGAGAGPQVLLAPQQGTPGALNYAYDVPAVRFRRSAVSLILALSLLLVAVRTGWHLAYVLTHAAYWTLMPIWALTFLVPCTTLFLSWLDRPYTVTSRQQQQLDLLIRALEP